NDAEFLFTDFLIDIQVFFANGKAPPIPVVSNNFWQQKSTDIHSKRPHLKHSLPTKENCQTQDIDPSNTKARVRTERSALLLPDKYITSVFSCQENPEPRPNKSAEIFSAFFVNYFN